ncbi:MAG: hypothetical protein KGI10_04095 [Thaumarchaeota archaeon]|nr:hypothetical protein [Nitrososphaerota archaeon]
MNEKEIILEALHKYREDSDLRRKNTKELYEKALNAKSYRGPKTPFDQSFGGYLQKLDELIVSVEQNKPIDTSEKKHYVCDALVNYLASKLHAERIMRKILINEDQILDENLKQAYEIQKKFCEGRSLGIGEAVIQELTKSV